VLLSPRWGSLLVAAWLGGIIVNLLTLDPPTYHDIAARDFALLLAAHALNRLATAFVATTVVRGNEAPQGRRLRVAAPRSTPARAGRGRDDDPHQVTAPFEAEPTSFAYFASAPLT
jgi:hypothetical protein